MNNFLLIASVVFFAVLAVVGHGKHEGGLLFAAILFFAFIGIKSLVTHLRLKASLPSGASAVEEEEKEELRTRLEEMDRRLTDIQDVMIALSEKFDRWEEERATV